MPLKFQFTPTLILRDLIHEGRDRLQGDKLRIETADVNNNPPPYVGGGSNSGREWTRTIDLTDVNRAL